MTRYYFAHASIIDENVMTSGFTPNSSINGNTSATRFHCKRMRKGAAKQTKRKGEKEKRRKGEKEKRTKGEKEKRRKGEKEKKREKNLFCNAHGMYNGIEGNLLRSLIRR